MSGGLRPITVEGRRFRWRFDGRLVIVPEGRSGPQLRIDWGWRDWLEPQGVGPEPNVVAPRFVAEAIGFALSRGWQPTSTGSSLSLDYHDGEFSASGPDA
jgi:hypothetical protein